MITAIWENEARGKLINIKYNLKQIYIKTHPYLGRPIS